MGDDGSELTSASLKRAGCQERDAVEVNLFPAVSECRGPKLTCSGDRDETDVM